MWKQAIDESWDLLGGDIDSRSTRMSQFCYLRALLDDYRFHERRWLDSNTPCKVILSAAYIVRPLLQSPVF